VAAVAASGSESRALSVRRGAAQAVLDTLIDSYEAGDNNAPMRVAQYVHDVLKVRIAATRVVIERLEGMVETRV
jgi:hypothetical protein